MSLADLIKKGSLRGFATATVATDLLFIFLKCRNCRCRKCSNLAANDQAIPEPATPNG